MHQLSIKALQESRVFGVREQESHSSKPSLLSLSLTASDVCNVELEDNIVIITIFQFDSFDSTHCSPSLPNDVSVECDIACISCCRFIF